MYVFDGRWICKEWETIHSILVFDLLVWFQAPKSISTSKQGNLFIRHVILLN